MKNVYGILNLHDGPELGELTVHHPLGAITFLGRFGIMDFALSNLSNSGIEKIGILVKDNYHSVRSHIKNGQIWINNTKTGALGEFLNEEAIHTPKFNTDVANIRANLSPLDKQIPADYIVVAPPFFIMSLDYNQIVERHIQSGADITLVYSHRTDADKEFINCDSLKINKDGYVERVSNNAGRKPIQDISLETYVINKNKFIELVKAEEEVSEMLNLRDMINYAINEKNIDLKVNTFAYEGLVLPILSLQNYVKYSFALLQESYHNQLFKKDWPIYTTNHNTAPTIYGPNAEVKNSFIGNGTIINGKVENSILSRNVEIKEGAVVKNCIIFTKASVDSGVKMKYVLAGKHCNISVKKNISGTADEIFFIRYGAKI